jgi:hypothetical protein
VLHPLRLHCWVRLSWRIAAHRELVWHLGSSSRLQPGQRTASRCWRPSHPVGECSVAAELVDTTVHANNGTVGREERAERHAPPGPGAAVDAATSAAAAAEAAAGLVRFLYRAAGLCAASQDAGLNSTLPPCVLCFQQVSTARSSSTPVAAAAAAQPVAAAIAAGSQSGPGCRLWRPNPS